MCEVLAAMLLLLQNEYRRNIGSGIFIMSRVSQAATHSWVHVLEQCRVEAPTVKGETLMTLTVLDRGHRQNHEDSNMKQTRDKI